MKETQRRHISNPDHTAAGNLVQNHHQMEVIAPVDGNGMLASHAWVFLVAMLVRPDGNFTRSCALDPEQKGPVPVTHEAWA